MFNVPMIATVNTLYHVTLMENECSIVELGIDPAFSQCKLAHSYFCTRVNVAWACGHISQLKRVTCGELLIFRAVIMTNAIKRTKWPGVFTVQHVVKPYCAETYMDFFRPTKSSVDYNLDIADRIQNARNTRPTTKR